MGGCRWAKWVVLCGVGALGLLQAGCWGAEFVPEAAAVDGGAADGGVVSGRDSGSSEGSSPVDGGGRGDGGGPGFDAGSAPDGDPAPDGGGDPGDGGGLPAAHLFGGAFERGAACTAACATPNPRTGACSCPAGSHEGSAWTVATDCAGPGTTAPADLVVCEPDDPDPAGAWGGGLVQVPGGGKCAACAAPNPQTGACSCGAGAMVVDLGALAPAAAGCGDKTMDRIVVCDRRGGAAEGFGGVYQVDDAVAGGGGCRAPNPATGACSCGAGATEARLRVIVAGGDGNLLGSTIVVCTEAP